MDRAAKEFQEKRLPGLTQEVRDAAGFDVPVEVDWDALRGGEQSWPRIYFEPLIEALKEIASDEMGQDELHGALKKIVITNRGHVRNGDGMARFDRGVLTLDHEPAINVNDVEDRRHGIRRVIEAAL
jgi:hypothetical protein